MNKPNIDLFDLLVSLYADQMGVEIKYERKKGLKRNNLKSPQESSAN
jgi:hypothetical protein